MHVMLSADDLALAERLGLARHASNRRAGTYRPPIAPGDGLAGDVDGMAAEIVVARLLGVEPDVTVNPRRGGCDLTVGGLRVDVKVTPYAGGQLVVPLSKRRGESDIYMLVTGRGREFVVRGWAWEDEVFRCENVGRLPSRSGRLLPENYILPQHRLHGLDGLLALISRPGTTGGVVG